MARKNTTKPTSLFVILKGRKPIDQQRFLDFLTRYDNVAVFDSADLQRNIPASGVFDTSTSLWHEFAWHIDSPIETLNVISSEGKPKDLDSILDEIESKLTESPTIHLTNFRITGPQFRRLVAKFADISLTNCHFGRGWAKPVESPVCKILDLDSCTSVEITAKVGQSKFKSLESLSINGPDCPLVLRHHCIYEDSDLNRSQTETFARSAAIAFWNRRINSIDLSDLDDIGFLTELPVPDGLESARCCSPVTVDVFNWILQNKRLRSLNLTWSKDVRLPFHRLKELKRLNWLEVVDTPLKDEELEIIASSSQVAGMMAYYTDLTSKSLPVILKWPGLKSFWGSQHMVGEVEPTDLPATTNLKEFVALNARTDWFREFFQGYPNLSVVDM